MSIAELSGSTIADHIDVAALAELQDLLEDDFPDLIGSFLQDADAGIDRLRSLCHQQNFAEIRRGAHSLKGSSLNIGALSLAALWADVETGANAEAPDLEAIQAGITSAIRQFGQVQQALSQVLATLQSN